MPAAAFFQTEKAACGGGSIITGSTASTPGSKSGALETPTKWRSIFSPRTEEGQGDASGGQSTSQSEGTKNSEQGAGDATQSGFVTPSKKAEEVTFPTPETAARLFPVGPTRGEPLQRTSTPASVTTTRASDVMSPTDSSVQRMFEKLGSTQSSTASPVPSGLNLSYSPATRQEIQTAFKEVRKVVTGSGVDSEEPLPEGAEAELETNQGEVPQVQRQDSSELMPPPPPAVEKPVQQPEVPALQPETEEADEFVYDLNSTRSSCATAQALEEIEGKQKQVTPAVEIPEGERLVVATTSSVTVTLGKFTEERGGSVVDSIVTTQTQTTVQPDQLETQVQMSLHAASQAQAQAEIARRSPPPKAAEKTPEETRRLYPSAAARMWYTARDKSYELVVECLKLTNTDKETQQMLLQRLGEFALQRETAFANPLITAQDIKQEALDEVEEAARNEAQRLREGWQKRKDAQVGAILRGAERRAQAGHPPLSPGLQERQLEAARAPPPAIDSTSASALRDVAVPDQPVESMTREQREALVTKPKRQRSKIAPTAGAGEDEPIVLSDTEEVEVGTKESAEEGEITDDPTEQGSASATIERAQTPGGHPIVIEPQAHAGLESDPERRRLAEEARQHGDVDLRTIKQEKQQPQ